MAAARLQHVFTLALKRRLFLWQWKVALQIATNVTFEPF